MKKIALIFSISVVAIVGLYWGSIAYSLDALQSAVRERNVIQLEKYVDWKQLRERLRSELHASMKARFMEELTRDKKADKFGAMLASTIGPAIIDRLIDNFVTPQGFAAILNRKTGAADAPLISQVVPKKGAVINQSLSSFDEYTLSLKSEGSTDEIKVILHRYGLIWRVVGISVPLDRSQTAAAVNSRQPSPARPSIITEANADLKVILTPKRDGTGLTIDGDIFNGSSQTRRVPHLRVSLRDGSKNDLGVWRIIDPPVQQLRAGEHARFTATFEQATVMAKGAVASFVSE